MSETQADGIVVEGTAPVARTNVPRDKFVVAWNQSSSAKEAAEKLGMRSPESASARASKHRKEGFVLKNMPLGGGAKLDPEATLLLCAQSLGITIEEARERGQKQIAAAGKRAAEKAAKSAK